MGTEKRLIDANALIHRVAEERDSVEIKTGCDIGYHNGLNMAVNAPTVEAVEVVHGRWDERDRAGIKIGGFMVCSNCNVMIPKADNNYYCLLRLNYCPNCGAKMDGDGNG